MGMPAASSVLCAGRSPPLDVIDVQGVDAHEGRARVDQVVAAAGREERMPAA